MSTVSCVLIPEEGDMELWKVPVGGPADDVGDLLDRINLENSNYIADELVKAALGKEFRKSFNSVKKDIVKKDENKHDGAQTDKSTEEITKRGDTGMNSSKQERPDTTNATGDGTRNSKTASTDTDPKRPNLIKSTKYQEILTVPVNSREACSSKWKETCSSPMKDSCKDPSRTPGTNMTSKKPSGTFSGNPTTDRNVPMHSDKEKRETSEQGPAIDRLFLCVSEYFSRQYPHVFPTMVKSMKNGKTQEVSMVKRMKAYAINEHVKSSDDAWGTVEKACEDSNCDIWNQLAAVPRVRTFEIFGDEEERIRLYTMNFDFNPEDYSTSTEGKVVASNVTPSQKSTEKTQGGAEASGNTGKGSEKLKDTNSSSRSKDEKVTGTESSPNGKVGDAATDEDSRANGQRAIGNDQKPETQGEHQTPIQNVVTRKGLLFQKDHKFSENLMPKVNHRVMDILDACGYSRKVQQNMTLRGPCFLTRYVKKRTRDLMEDGKGPATSRDFTQTTSDTKPDSTKPSSTAWKRVDFVLEDCRSTADWVKKSTMINEEGLDDANLEWYKDLKEAFFKEKIDKYMKTIQTEDEVEVSWDLSRFSYLEDAKYFVEYPTSKSVVVSYECKTQAVFDNIMSRRKKDQTDKARVMTALSNFFRGAIADKQERKREANRSKQRGQDLQRQFAEEDKRRHAANIAESLMADVKDTGGISSVKIKSIPMWSDNLPAPSPGEVDNLPREKPDGGNISRVFKKELTQFQKKNADVPRHMLLECTFYAEFSDISWSICDGIFEIQLQKKVQDTEWPKIFEKYVERPPG